MLVTLNVFLVSGFKWNFSFNKVMIFLFYYIPDCV